MKTLSSLAHFNCIVRPRFCAHSDVKILYCLRKCNCKREPRHYERPLMPCLHGVTKLGTFDFVVKNLNAEL